MLTLFKELNKNQATVWVYENKLKLTFTGETLPDQLIDKVKQKRENILDFLNEKSIFSEEDFRRFIFSENPAGVDDPSTSSKNKKIEAIFPATSLQQGFVYHYLAQPQDDAYRVQLLLDYHASINVDAYQQAWTLASRRFPILRTAFNWEGKILQIVTAGASIDSANFRHEDITQLSEEERNRAIDTFQQHDRTLPFNLRQPGLARFTLIKQHQQLVTVLITMHHSIIDGWSYPVLLQTVHDYYNALAQGRTPEIVVDNAYLATQQYYRDHQTDTDVYWSERKAHWQGANDLSALLSHRINLTQIKTVEKPAEQQLIMQDNAYEQLKNTCRTQGVTLNVALQFAWHKLLHIYTGDEQTIVGTTVSGRDIPITGIESSVGLYINTLPLMVQWRQTDSVATVLQNIQKDIADLNSHSAVSLASLQSDGERLFQSLLVFENYPAPVAGENQTGIEQSQVFRRAVEKVDYPLSLMAYEQDNRLIIKLSYGKDWLEDEQAQRLLGQLEHILHAVTCHSDQSHTTITCLSEAERHTLLHSWNQTAAPYPQDKTLPQLFELQASQRPDATAVIFENQSISYGELNRRANQLAHHLIALGVRPDDRVAICLERSLDMVTGILAILKAGGAYLPLDPAYPAERLRYMLEDAAPVALLTQTTQADKLTTSVPTVWLDNPALGFDTQPDTNPDTQALGLTARHLAYVIYTSGSTGQPKGVMVEHRNVLRLIINNGFADIGPADCIAHCANPAFDAATWEIWAGLIHGARVLLIPEKTLLHPDLFSQCLSSENVSALFLTTALFNQYADLIAPTLSGLRYVLFGGELSDNRAAIRLRAAYAPTHLLHVYGPTETTTFATAYDIPVTDSEEGKLPIGRPISNTQIYILDKQGQPVPQGAAGEIYIGGDGVARGYLNQPDLTAERFLTNPFSSEPGARMYKTGDLARWLPDGNIECLGRNDFQVKIRGFRIELGEIETALTAHPQVKQAVVIDREHHGKKVLVAYLVTEGAVSDDMLLTHLSEHLPDYMLPDSFTFMEAIPLTLNGKVDRRALPEPVFGNRENYVAPRNTLETQLCAIWQDVLALERVGIEDNFFRIGGNSLTAIKLIAAIRRTLSTDISLAQLFELKTIAGLATQMDEQIRTVIPHLTQSRYPLSFAQERMLFIEQYEQGSNVYHIPYLVQLDQDASLPLLDTAINRLAERHAVLRTVYRSDEHDQSYQQVLDENLVIQSQSCDDRDRLLASVRTEIATPFDLTAEPSLRLRHYQVANSHYLLLLWHHIAMDGWSVDIFMAELAESYHALQAGRDSPLPELEITYGDYAVWQRDYLQGDVREQQLAYWQQALAGYESLALPADHPRPAQVNYQGRDVNFELDIQLSDQLRILAKTQETTLYTVLLSAFYVTLAKLSGQADIVIGTPTDNRHHTQTQPLLGMFVNSLALRAQLQHTDSVTALIKQTHQLVTGAKAHQDMPFEQLLDALNIERDTARHPIFQVMFSVQTFGENSSAGNLPFSPVTLDETLYSPAKFDLSLFLSDGKTAITGCLNYALSLFHETRITRITDIYQRVLSAFVADQQQPLSGIDILSAQERRTLLHSWNQTAAPYPQDKTLPQLFEARAAQRPDAIAVIFENQRIRYGELNRRANQLAHHLIALGVRPDDRVAICLERSLDMVVGILAILKAGGAYLPLDPAYPAERLHYMLEDAAPVALLTQTTQADKLTTSVPTVWLDNSALGFDTQPDTNPDTQALGLTARHLAYVIYTSGSTGQPKGVMVEHRNVLRLIINNGFADIGPADCVAHCANPAFDAATWEIWSALLNGGCLHIVPQAVLLEPTGFREALFKGKVTALWLTVGLFNEYLDTLQPVFGQLRYLLVGGDVLNPQKIKQVLSADHPPAHLLNGYGPTESTTFATTYAITAPVDVTQSIPIGRPIANTRIYLLDADQQPVPMGASGEIYISGDGVARGYLNQPELTTARFLPDPFVSTLDAKMYKTGDLGRWLPDGNIEYLGRNDFQVKIRGFRIELGEIETALVMHPQVKQAVVIDRVHHGHKVLAAYLVIEGILADEALVTHLSSRLPDYMLPASFTFLDAIPLTLNGKVDRRALPDPIQITTDHYAAPRNALENQLCTLWQNILGVDQVGIHDNFFRIGGDSIISIQLASRLRQAGFSLQVKTIFEAPTVAQLAPLLMQTPSTTDIVAEQGVLNGEFALLPVQQAFFSWQFAHPHHWNQAFMVQIPGNIQFDQLERALNRLTERHDILRARFVATEQGYRQCYSADISSSQSRLKHRDIRQCNQEELHQQLTQWQSGFDYHNGPLWQAAHLTGYADGSARLFFAFHHLIIDAVSWRIIAEHMRLLLQGMALPAKTSSYRQWVTAVHQYAQQHQHEVAYWQQVLAGNDSKPVLDSLTHHQLEISAEMTDILLHEANTGYHTEINDLLLSALSVALQATFDQSVNRIILEGHGRESIDNTIDVSETVGWFTTLYPVRLENQADMVNTLIHTKEMLRAVPNKGIGYGALQQAGYLTDDLPAISFNYLGQLGSASRQEWSIADDDCGNAIASENDSHLLLGVNGAVQAGKLLFYVDSRLPQAKTALFIRAFEQALNDVITTAQKQAQTGGIKTASDYGINGLSVKLLRQLQQQYQVEALYPASSLQQGFVYHYLAQPQDDAYRVQLLLDYHAPVDVAAYQHAWALTSLRFPILRTAFNWAEDVLQIITEGASICPANFDMKDISQLPEETRNEAIDAIQQYDRTLPFDLNQPGLARFTLIKQHQQLLTVLITLHHSIIDGWSYPILLQTVHDYYNALAQGCTPDIVVDNAYLATQQYYRDHQAEADIYWSERKAQWQGANDLSALLSHRVDLTQIKTVEKPAEQQLIVQDNAYEQLKNTCRTQGVTLNVALQFAWHKLLHIYTGDEQTIVGTTVSGRDIPVEGIESSVGLYINTLPLTVKWKQTDSVATVLQNIQKGIADLNSHSAVSLASLQSDGERLFQSLLVFENYPAPVAGENQTGIEQTLAFRHAIEKVDYPLSLIAYEQDNRLVIKFNYGKDWLEDEQAQRLLGQLEHILHAVTCHSDQSHTTITALSETERHTLLHSWNQTTAPYPQDKTLPQLFEMQAAQRPDATAVIFENQRIRYGELNRRANQLAHHLIALGVRPDDRVAICLERSLDMVTGILAILKAGGAYLPLDPAYPAERLHYMLEDAAPVALLTQTTQADKLTTSVPTVWLDNSALGFDTQPDTNPDTQALGLTARHLAYVIYTSGSTGHPKGVMVEHRNVLRLIINNGFADIGPADCIAHCANPAFDAATWEIWAGLIHGARVLLIPEKTLLHPDRFSQCLSSEGVSALFLTTALFNQYADLIAPTLSGLRYVLFGGELSDNRAAIRLRAAYAPTHLLHVYGPTETTTFATAYDIPVTDSEEGKLPIGRPISNTQIYILDKQGQPVPQGAAGEIYIGGDGVARGYLNQPDLTAERFLTNPFSSEPGARMYKTGDLGRWLPDGNIECLGRNDFQVKIRGFRIELGEIETAL
ncbi:non-ribosomal peptide synthetase, partial [Xenorhabdus khoisanae]|uniref:non-ribosomal peptide synthetase n=1 Tax=Xenorhabdus khoisanae TaxID=880157 RepID=UPI00069D15BB